MSDKRTGAGSGPRGFGRARLWFGLLGGACAWLAHLLIAYVAAEFGCVGHQDRSAALGISLVAWIVLAVSGATLLVAVAATVIAYRIHARLAAPGAAVSGEPAAGARDVARAGWITSALFALVIVVESLPVLYYLRDC